ncbi:BON domain-containing protein (plasmid) [Rhizobium indicum]|uniref:BON domain-containing protein n=1 Tax=Rhizobium indicum TaxID=2583231 RepID=UPI001106F884|nr:BON domain-containing protein [Rhizobium indicum]QKK33399.1 BON domain-containing protein [Rhizobium indicum]
MKFSSDSYGHEECCSQGHSSASTIATIEAALSADSNIDSSAIQIRMLGPVVLLEGYITNTADREKAISLAAMIVGQENVQDRMLSRFPSSSRRDLDGLGLRY